jgi:small subunit ribosomal protein S1
VQLAEGVEGLVHVSEVTAERRINHPQDVLRVGQTVKALVLAIDPEKRQFKLSIKQLVPTSIKEYLAEHKVDDVVSGRVVEQSPDSAIVELGEGIRATCRIAASASAAANVKKSTAGVDLSALTSMLNARWKGSAPVAGSQPEPLSVGQIRSFRIVQLDHETEKIDLQLA